MDTTTTTFSESSDGTSDSSLGLHTMSTKSAALADVTPALTSPKVPASSQQLTWGEQLLLLSNEQRATAEEILDVTKYVIYVMALPTTIITLAVFMQKNMRSATSTYVIGLSIAQLFYILTSVIGTIMEAASSDPLNDYGYLIYSIYITSYVTITVKRASHLILCFVSVERLYAIVKPFHIKEFVLARFPVLFTIIAFVAACVWDVYIILKTYAKPMVSSRTNTTIYIFVYTDLYKAAPEIGDGFGTWAPIVFTYIPLLLLGVLNGTTLWALKRHNVHTTRVGQTTASEKARQNQERQMTVTILAATVCYVILTVPYAAHNLAKNATTSFDKRGKYENLYYVLRSVTFNLTLLSCAVDFFCFLFLSSGFRRTFNRLLRVKQCTGKAGTKSTGARGTSMGMDSVGDLNSQTDVSEVETKY